MKPPVFDYVAPTAVEEAVALLGEHDFDAKILAGGQSLMPLLNMRLARPSLLIDVARIPDLDFIRVDDSAVSIGAMTRQRTLELSAEVRERLGLPSNQSWRARGSQSCVEEPGDEEPSPNPSSAPNP